MIERPARRRLTESESDRLITEHAPLVKAIAQSLLRRLPASVALDDLMQDGFIGLLGALLHATQEKAAGQFQKYLSQRVRGAMLDGLRQNDPGSRSVRREMRRVEMAIHELSHTLGRSPREEEVAAALDMPLAAYQKLLQEADGYTVFSLEDFNGGDASVNFLDWCATTKSDPVAALERRALQRNLLIAISDLTPREEEVMILLYVGDLTMRSIGEKIELTEGRVSQIHSQAIAKLRAAVIGADDSPSLLAPRRRARSEGETC